MLYLLILSLFLARAHCVNHIFESHVTVLEGSVVSGDYTDTLHNGDFQRVQYNASRTSGVVVLGGEAEFFPTITSIECHESFLVVRGVDNPDTLASRLVDHVHVVVVGAAWMSASCAEVPQYRFVTGTFEVKNESASIVIDTTPASFADCFTNLSLSVTTMAGESRKRRFATRPSQGSALSPAKRVTVKRESGEEDVVIMSPSNASSFALDTWVDHNGMRPLHVTVARQDWFRKGTVFTITLMKRSESSIISCGILGPCTEEVASWSNVVFPESGSIVLYDTYPFNVSKSMRAFVKATWTNSQGEKHEVRSGTFPIYETQPLEVVRPSAGMNIVGTRERLCVDWIGQPDVVEYMHLEYRTLWVFWQEAVSKASFRRGDCVDVSSVPESSAYRVKLRWKCGSFFTFFCVEAFSQVFSVNYVPALTIETNLIGNEYAIGDSLTVSWKRSPSKLSADADVRVSLKEDLPLLSMWDEAASDVRQVTANAERASLVVLKGSFFPMFVSLEYNCRLFGRWMCDYARSEAFSVPYAVDGYLNYDPVTRRAHRPYTFQTPNDALSVECLNCWGEMHVETTNMQLEVQARLSQPVSTFNFQVEGQIAVNLDVEVTADFSFDESLRLPIPLPPSPHGMDMSVLGIPLKFGVLYGLNASVGLLIDAKGFMALEAGAQVAFAGRSSYSSAGQTAASQYAVDIVDTTFSRGADNDLEATVALTVGLHPEVSFIVFSLASVRAIFGARVTGQVDFYSGGATTDSSFVSNAYIPLSELDACSASHFLDESYNCYVDVNVIITTIAHSRGALYNETFEAPPLFIAAGCKSPAPRPGSSSVTGKKGGRGGGDGWHVYLIVGAALCGGMLLLLCTYHVVRRVRLSRVVEPTRTAPPTAAHATSSHRHLSRRQSSRVGVRQSRHDVHRNSTSHVRATQRQSTLLHIAQPAAAGYTEVQPVSLKHEHGATVTPPLAQPGIARPPPHARAAVTTSSELQDAQAPPRFTPRRPPGPPPNRHHVESPATSPRLAHARPPWQSVANRTVARQASRQPSRSALHSYDRAQ